jgi:uncharacterized protein YbaR (Trm112 family)
MHRAFAIDVLVCPHCGGRLRLIATLHDPAVIRKILAHLGLSRSGQSPRPSRVRRRRVLIGSSRARRAAACLRRETPSALIRSVRGQLTAALCQPSMLLSRAGLLDPRGGR